MLLNELKKSPGLTDKANRVGRGNGGKGNYCGKGLKGQKARSGGGVPDWFEGGQTPLHMRLPKLRGFKRYFKLLKNVTPVSLDRLESSDKISSGMSISSQVLASLGFCRKTSSSVKIVGNTALTKKLSFESDIAFSESAKQNILSSGSSIAE